MKEELVNAHEALTDTTAAISVFEKIIEIDKDKKVEDKVIGETMDGILKFIDRKVFLDFAGTMYRDEKGDLIFNIGKNKGKKVLDNKGMLNWMLKEEFPLDTKNWCQKIIKGEVK
jgi:DNA polymerase-3 subunit epsilon